MKKSKANKRNTGVIVFGGHVQGYGIIRIYGENKIPCIVIDNASRSIARHSKYCNKFYKRKYEDVLNLLFQFRKKGQYHNWLLIPTDDYYVRILSLNKSELNKYFIVTVDNWDNINIFFNKNNSYPLVENANVPCPHTYYPKHINDLNIIDKDISYPCIIKPAIMKDFYSIFKKKVFMCNDFADLNKNYKRTIAQINPEEILIQEIIPGSNENQYSVGIFFDRDKSYNYLVGNRVHQHPIDFGNATTYAETVDIPILIEYAHRILSKAKYFGLCEVEFKYNNRDQKYKFLEVNPRTWKWHLISKYAEIPFLMSIYEYFIENKPIIVKKFKIVGWLDILTDFPTVIKMKSRKLYKKRKKIVVISAVFNPVDLKPFIFQIWYYPYNLFKR